MAELLASQWERLLRWRGGGVSETVPGPGERLRDWVGAGEGRGRCDRETGGDRRGVGIVCSAELVRPSSRGVPLVRTPPLRPFSAHFVPKPQGTLSQEDRCRALACVFLPSQRWW